MLKKFVVTVKSNPHATTHALLQGDCIEMTDEIPKESVDLVITDPPYNIGLNYGVFKDRMKKEDYFQYIQERLRKSAEVLKKTGSIYIISYPEIAARLLPFLEDELKLKFRRWITWHYPTNIGHSKKNFTRSQRTILFLTKGDRYKFNRKNATQPYKNPNVDKIKELIEKGKIGRISYDGLKHIDLAEAFKIQKDLSGIVRMNSELSDFIEMNLLKNVSKDRMRNINKRIPKKKQHPCQLPLDLLRFLIKISSNEGGIVLDPFAGTFTTSAAATKLNRNSIGIEKNPRYVKMGKRRLEN